MRALKFNNEHRKSNAKLLYDIMKIAIAVLILAPIAKGCDATLWVVTKLLLPRKSKGWLFFHSLIN